MSKKNYIIPIFIPELACPFQCLYCNQEKISGQKGLPSDQEIIDIIEMYLSSIPKDANIEISFFGGNFTGIPIKKQEHFLQLVSPWIQNGRVKSLRCSTRPDDINDQVIELFKQFGGKTIELGAQSLNEDVLKKSKRGHGTLDVEKAVKLIKDHHLNVGLQMMIGLPGDSKEKSIETAKQIIRLGADNTRIYPTLVIKNTGLHQLFDQGKYAPLSIDEAVDWCVEIVELFENANILIQRVGLHPSEELQTGNELIAGPFHPSFRELVLTEIWKRKIEAIVPESEHLIIQVNPKEYNYAIGYQSKNKKALQETYKTVVFEKNSNLTGRIFIPLFPSADKQKSDYQKR